MLKNAKTFCKESGFPVAYIRRLCRLGILPYWKCGRMYLLDDQRTLERLENLKEQTPIPPYVAAPVPTHRRNRQIAVRTMQTGKTGSERLRQLLKLKKEQEQTAQGG